jgi:hypothetical protein
MLCADAVFDISFEQFGQSGFMESLEILMLQFAAISEQFPRTALKNANRPASIRGTVFNGDPVTVSGFPNRKDPAGNRHRARSLRADAARNG